MAPLKAHLLRSYSSSFGLQHLALFVYFPHLNPILFPRTQILSHFYEVFSKVICLNIQDQVDILEGSGIIRPSEGDGIPVELFQILKTDAVKVLHLICQQIWKTRQWSQDWKRSVFIPIPKKGNAKECSNYCKIALISHASKVMLKVLQARLQ